MDLIDDFHGRGGASMNTQSLNEYPFSLPRSKCCNLIGC